MASVSFSMTLDSGRINTLAAGTDEVTLGTAAPGTGSLELRVDNAVGWRKAEILLALDRLTEAVLANSDVVV